MKYYINTTTETHQYLLDTINNINTNEIDIEITDENGNRQVIKESVYLKRQKISSVIPH